MPDAAIRAATRAYLRDNFLYMRPNLKVGDGDSLLKAGVIDSLGVMELVQFVERDFGIAVDPSEIVEANFVSIDNIARYVVGKKAVQPSA